MSLFLAHVAIVFVGGDTMPGGGIAVVGDTYGYYRGAYIPVYTVVYTRYITYSSTH